MASSPSGVVKRERGDDEAEGTAKQAKCVKEESSMKPMVPKIEDSGLRQKTRRGIWIRTRPTMSLHRFGGFTVDACAAPGDVQKREPGSSEEEVT